MASNVRFGGLSSEGFLGWIFSEMMGCSLLCRQATDVSVQKVQGYLGGACHNYLSPHIAFSAGTFSQWQARNIELAQ